MHLNRIMVTASASLVLGCGQPSPGDAPEGSSDPPAHITTAAARVSEVHADSVAILADLAYLSADERGGRRPLEAGSVEARARVEATFKEAGLRPFDDRFQRPFTAPGTTDTIGVNVVGWLPGSDDEDRYIVLTAHFDHMGVRDGVVFNGADDNASGTAALLFLARHLAEHPLRHPVVLAAVDTEESGLRGARAFVTDPPVPAEQIALNVNMDMLSRGNGTLWAAGAHATPSLRPLLDRVATEAPLTLRQGHDRPGVPGEMDWTQSSDHGPFHDAGIPWVYFGVEDHPDVHAPTDDFERIEPSDYLNAVRTVVLALHLLDAELDSVER